MQFNYKKHIYIFFGFLALAFSVFLILCSISAYLLYFHAPIYLPADYGLQNTFAIREYRFQHLKKDEPAIFIISGSNSFLGISSPLLEKELGYQVFNFATSINTPLAFQFNFIKEYARENDIIIAPLEYSYTESSPNITPWVYNNFTTWGLNYQKYISQEMQSQITRRNILTYWSRIPNISQKAPQSMQINNDTLSLSTFKHNNLYTEILSDAPATEKLKSNFPTGNYIINTNNHLFIEEIKKFTQYAQEHKIKFYLTFPVSLKTQNFNTDNQKTRSILDNYRQYLVDNGINFFGTASFSNFDFIYGADALYHINATGAILRTLLLAEDINTYIFNKEASYEQGKEQEFYQAKEKEALEYIELLRKENTPS